MVGRWKHFIILVVLLLNFSGCSEQENIRNEIAEKQTTIVKEQTEEYISTQDTNEIQTDAIAEETQSTTEEEIEESVVAEKMQQTGYAYRQLSEAEQKVYQEIYQALISLTAEQQVSTNDSDNLNKIFQCVMNDHPEIFYANGYQYKLYTVQDQITKIVFEGIYTKDASEIAVDQQLIAQYVNNCLADMPQDASDYEKVKYLYEYIILHTEYSNQSIDSQNICSVLIDQQSVCQGYAKAMQYLCNIVGIESTLVTGYANGEGHAWNLVLVEGQPYYVDTTWGDASYVITGADTYEGNVPPITYDYLLVTTNMLESTHQIENVVSMPECTSMDYNYYVQENCFFSSFDEEHVKTVFEQAIEKNNQYVTIKCSDDAVYTEIKEQLINEQKVFTYLASANTSIAYSENELQLTLSFWLV